MRNGIIIGSQSISPRNPYYEKKNFIVRQSGRYHLNEAITINITSNEVIKIECQLIVRNENITFALFLPKIQNLNLVMRKFQTNPN